MKKIMVSILAALGLHITSCAQSENIKSVNADEFQTAITADTVQLVDVRTADEYAEGRIAYAVNIDVRKPNFAQEVDRQLDKQKLTYVYCRSGRRSLDAAEALAKKGFKVVNLRGGIIEWQQGGKPVKR